MKGGVSVKLLMQTCLDTSLMTSYPATLYVVLRHMRQNKTQLIWIQII